MIVPFLYFVHHLFHVLLPCLDTSTSKLYMYSDHVGTTNFSYSIFIYMYYTEEVTLLYHVFMLNVIKHGNLLGFPGGFHVVTCFKVFIGYDEQLDIAVFNVQIVIIGYTITFPTKHNPCSHPSQLFIQYPNLLTVYRMFCINIRIMCPFYDFTYICIILFHNFYLPHIFLIWKSPHC